MKEKKWTYYMDASTTNTGVVLVCLESREAMITNLDFSRFKNNPTLSKADNLYFKLRFIKEKLDKFTQQYPPNGSIILEGIFIQPKYMNSSEALLKLHGFLMGYFMGSDFSFIPPSSIKKAITGKGNSSKNIVRKTLEETYDIQFDNNDQSDAFAVMMTHFMKQGLNARDLKIQFSASSF